MRVRFSLGFKNIRSEALPVLLPIPTDRPGQRVRGVSLSFRPEQTQGVGDDLFSSYTLGPKQEVSVRGEARLEPIGSQKLAHLAELLEEAPEDSARMVSEWAKTRLEREGYLVRQAVGVLLDGRLHYWLEVWHDGRGIDLEAVKRQAVLQGLRRPEEVHSLSPEQAVELIFLPGLSTSETVTRQAGRGVGMDVVLANLRRLKGEIIVQTEPGSGTLFRLRVPLTLIVSDVLMVQVGGELLAIPGESLRTLRAVRAQDLLNLDDGPALEFEGEAVSILYLHELLGSPLPQGPRRSFAIVETGEGRLALGVDAFLGLEQAVVKSLDEPVGSLPHLAGATISAEGRVIVVLNPGGLRRMGRQEAPRWNGAAAGSAPTPLERGLKILMVDDSLSIRRVVGQMLTRWGHQVHTAGDGYEALELLQDNRYDVVITDLEMPRVNGFELLDEVRRRPDLRETPVFVLTSRAGEKHQALAAELGARGYLTKPLEETKLQSLLSTVKKRAEV